MRRIISIPISAEEFYLNQRREEGHICGDCHSFHDTGEKVARLKGRQVYIKKGKCADEKNGGLTVPEDESACFLYSPINLKVKNK